MKFDRMWAWTFGWLMGGMFGVLGMSFSHASPDLGLGPVAPGEAYRVSEGYDLPATGYTQRPPRVMTGNARAIVETVDPDDVAERCATPDALACMKDIPGEPTIVIPNPCAFPFDDYAALLCHEFGHVSGWRHPEDET